MAGDGIRVTTASWSRLDPKTEAELRARFDELNLAASRKVCEAAGFIVIDPKTEAAGYIVAGRNRHGVMEADWDGEPQADLSAGERSLSECRAAGYADWQLYALLPVGGDSDGR